jgi:DNA polymerase-1
MITAENQDKVLQLIKDAEIVSLYVEGTDHNPHRSDIVGVALSFDDRNFYVPFETFVTWKEGRDWLVSLTFRKVVYDAKKTRILLNKQNIPLAGITFDVFLGAYLRNPSEGSVDLHTICSDYLNYSFLSDEDVYGKGRKRQLAEGEALQQHLCRKSRAIYDIYPILLEKLTADSLLSLLEEIELPLSHTLCEMELQGVQVDETQLKELGMELKEQSRKLEEDISQLAGTEFNINSPKQLGYILFEKLGLPPVKKTKTGYSTDVEELEKLAPQHKIAEKIVHFRQVGKLLSTYVEGLQKEIHADAKIHTHFNQTITATGRLSSTEPNLQNIPIRLEEGRRIRKVFVPSQKDDFILAADYSQIELRILAHLSQDKNLQKAFQEDKDIHTQTAMDVFKIEEECVTSDMRRQAKAVNFGIVYGISDYGLSQNLNIPRGETKQFIERYFETYPGVKKYMESTIQTAREKGYVTTLLQRRRYLPDINSRNYNLRSFAERTAMNTPIQGTAADIIKVAMVKLGEEIKQMKLKSKMLLQVHDELVFEVPKEELEEMKQLVKRVMEHSLSLSVTLKVDISVGKNWYEAK